MTHRVAIVQSSYIPWKGYFDIIHDVDEFIFLDCVQFTVRDWRSRNRIVTPNGLLWLSVPAGSKRSRLISEVVLEDPTWQARHWQTIRHAYSRAPGFRLYRELFEELYLGQTWTSLSRMNQHMTMRIAREVLGIGTRFTDAGSLAPEGHKLELILEIVRKSGATHYLSGPAAQAYIDPARFESMGVQLEYKSYAHYPEYPQAQAPFEHGVSIIDLVFNTGADAPDYIWGRNARPAAPATSSQEGAAP